MVTKVGHARPMLICTDCGLPLDQRDTAAIGRRRLWGALWLVAMALMSVAMMLLAMSYESRRVNPLEDSLERADDGSGEAAKRERDDPLMEFSKLMGPGSSREGEAPAERLNASGSANGATEGTGAPPPPPPARNGSADR